MTRALPLLLLGIFLGGPCRGADEDKKGAKWNTTAECQMIVLPQKLALPLLPELLDEARIESAFAKLQELIANGTAKLAAHLIVKSHDGEKASAESVEELRYATEFEPPRLPQNVPNDLTILKHWPVVGITPTAFETRNVGRTFEVVVTPEKSGKLLTVDATPVHVRLLRWAKTDAGKLANGEQLAIEQPIFHSLRNTSKLVLRSGQRVLLGVHKVPEPAAPDTMELFFVRAWATPIVEP